MCICYIYRKVVVIQRFIRSYLLLQQTRVLALFDHCIPIIEHYIHLMQDNKFLEYIAHNNTVTATHSNTTTHASTIAHNNSINAASTNTTTHVTSNASTTTHATTAHTTNATSAAHITATNIHESTAHNIEHTHTPGHTHNNTIHTTDDDIYTTLNKVIQHDLKSKLFYKHINNNYKQILHIINKNTILLKITNETVKRCKVEEFIKNKKLLYINNKNILAINIKPNITTQDAKLFINNNDNNILYKHINNMTLQYIFNKNKRDLKKITYTNNNDYFDITKYLSYMSIIDLYFTCIESSPMYMDYAQRYHTIHNRQQQQGGHNRQHSTSHTHIGGGSGSGSRSSIGSSSNIGIGVSISGGVSHNSMSMHDGGHHSSSGASHTHQASHAIPTPPSGHKPSKKSFTRHSAGGR